MGAAQMREDAHSPVQPELAHNLSAADHGPCFFVKLPWHPQVVFGAPLSHRPGEDVADFHSRYVAALVDLGKQHGVELSVV